MRVYTRDQYDDKYGIDSIYPYEKDENLNVLAVFEVDTPKHDCYDQLHFCLLDNGNYFSMVNRSALDTESFNEMVKFINLPSHI